MSVEITVTLSDQDLRVAEELVEEGRYPSVPDVVSAALTRVRMLERALDDPLSGMADEIRRRAELPEDQRIPWDGKAMADRLNERLARRFKKEAPDAVHDHAASAGRSRSVSDR
jgi:antitoxin ParD1/3/4